MGDLNRLEPSGFFLPKILKLFGFPIFLLFGAYLMTVVLETRHAH